MSDGYKPLRDKKGRWLKGTSANPGGRPPGTRNRVAQRIFDKLEPDMEGVLRTLQTAALNGDTQSARFLLSLYVPRARQAHADIGTELPPRLLMRAMQSKPVKIGKFYKILAWNYPLKGRHTPGRNAP
jgi:hypothetical protein